MRRLSLVFFLLSLMSFTNTACTSHDKLDQNQFSQILLDAFHSQETAHSVVNGTLQFSINPDTTLFVRNAQLSLQTSIAPFIVAGLETKESILINKYMVYNKGNQTLLIAKNHIQTMDLQFFTDKEISKNLYNSIHTLEESLDLNYTGEYVYLSDGLLLFKFNNTSFEVGIHKNVLISAGVDLSYLPHSRVEGNYVILPNKQIL